MNTLNPAYPHPDDDHEPEPITLQEAISLAYAALMHEGADMLTRRRAAFDLIDTFNEHQDDIK